MTRDELIEYMGNTMYGKKWENPLKPDTLHKRWRLESWVDAFIKSGYVPDTQ